LVGVDPAHHGGGFAVLRLFFKGAHSRVAVEKLAVVEGCVELDVSRLSDLSKVLHINVAQLANGKKQQEWCDI
jgi:hypothetical protein